MFRNIILFLGLIMISKLAYSQSLNVKGIITDTLQNPLVYANILAVPNSNSEEIRFAISNEKGNYKLELSANRIYEISVSYLGYTPQITNITTENHDFTKNFILKENLNELDEVTLSYTPPIVVKKDTITYKVNAFTTGEERKLREVLKKLPGVEVDKAGNVTVQGKKVTKVLVEGKTFFTGDSKMAVNNIPADAVDQVEVLDNYNEVAMLKGLHDNDDMAMNIKLKADKKKFAFGDMEVGAGMKERYLVHPNLFYYSPKTNVNFIGSIGNTGDVSFTLKDFIDFQGGIKTLLNDSQSFLNIENSIFYNFLNNNNFTTNTNQFGALNIRQSVSKVTDISGYIITSNSQTNTRSNLINEYLNRDGPFIEDRTTTNQLHNFFTIGKLTIDYDPSYDEDFAYNSFVKVTNNNSNGLINTMNPTQSNNINTLTDITGLNLKQNISYSRKLSKVHTATLEATYNFQNDKPITEWLTNQQILQGLIPLQTEALFNILQTQKSSSHNVSAITKDYWVLNNFNHLYTSVGANVAFSDFFNEDVQLLNNGTINNFNSSGFGNDFGYNFIDTFVSLEYKFQIGIATFKPMLYAHFYNWTTAQYDVSQSHNKTVLLPQFTTKIEFNNSEKINFKYSLNARFPSIERLADNFIVTSFNSVFKGNSDLENQLYHSVSLSYYKFSLFKNLNLNLNTIFNKKVEHFKNVTQLQGIEQFSTQILFNEPEYSWNVSGGIAKKINKVRYKLRSRFNYNDFFQIVNDETSLNISKSVSSTASAETMFKNYPNLEIGYTKDFNNYRSRQNKNAFENDNFFVNLQYDYLDFIIKLDYSFDSYTNKNNNIQNTFETANASLFYQVEDSPWGFEINATNIFNTEFRQQNSFSDFLISDSKTFILPRIIMFKIAYKL